MTRTDMNLCNPQIRKASLAVVLAGCLAALVAGCNKGDSTGDAGDAGDAAAAGAKPYPLKTCIVSDEALDSMGQPASLVHEGQEVKFCCKDCIKDFQSDPAKYLAKLAPQAPAPGN